MSYIDRVDYIVSKLNARFLGKVRFERVLMKDGTFKIQALQQAIYTGHQGKRRRVSQKRIQAAILEFNNEYKDNQ